MAKPIPKLLDPSEAAAMLGVSKNRFYELVRSGDVASAHHSTLIFTETEIKNALRIRQKMAKKTKFGSPPIKVPEG